MANIVHQQFGTECTPIQILLELLDRAEDIADVIVVTRSKDDIVEVAFSSAYLTTQLGMLQFATYDLSKEMMDRGTE